MVAILAPLRDQIADDVAAQDDEQRALDAIDRALEGFETSQELLDAIMQPTSQVDLAGQLMVHDVQAPTSLSQRFRYRFKLDGNNFLSLPWPEAIEAFRNRGIMDDRELERLLGQYRERSGEARRLMLEHLRGTVRDELLRQLEEGGTFAEFAQAVRDEQVTFGIGGADQAYLETVYRTNLQTAYGAGRFRAINEPDVALAFPYWQSRSSGDDRVEPQPCGVLATKIFRVGNAVTDVLYSPNHFSCRCASVPLSEGDLRGRRVWDTIPPGGEPMAGFSQSPAALVSQALCRPWSTLGAKLLNVETDEALTAGGELMKLLADATGLGPAELLAAVRDDIEELAKIIEARSEEDGTAAENNAQ